AHSPELPPFLTNPLARRVRRAARFAFALALAGTCFLWMTWRTFFKYVEPGEMLIITASSGDPLEPGQMLARPGQKGVQEEVLGEGRHFVLPILYSVEIVPCIEVKPGKVGVVTAKAGKTRPADRMLAEPGEQGIWRQVLPPGRYRLNPYGYE